ncbi:MAG: methylmalonyl Co-A mutase-associated GTPase MeaB [Spirosomataceae bacterium]|jgi:LAO/AO transport system kinase
MAAPRLTIDQYFEGIKQTDTSVLSRGITLVESKSPKDRELAFELIKKVLPFTGKSIRIGITGSPGVGKSTFIDGFVEYLVNEKKIKTAVLAIDPSSKVSGGSILGDKTRMESIVGSHDVFIRPSPAGLELGGVGAATFETMLLCEAAGYELIIVETVGVGQSETVVNDLTDFLIFLTIAGAGDELQGIKRGIMETVDLVVVNKADTLEGKTIEKLRLNFKNALHLFPGKASGREVSVLSCSALQKIGFEKIWNEISAYEIAVKGNGHFENNRMHQKKLWLQKTLERSILEYIYQNEEIKNQKEYFEKMLSDQNVNPLEAASRVFNIFKSRFQ